MGQHLNFIFQTIKRDGTKKVVKIFWCLNNMSFQQKRNLEFTFLFDPMWSHTEVFSGFKKAIQNLDYLSKDEIKPFLQVKTFKDILVIEKSVEKMPLCMLIAHLTNGCYALHQGIRRKSLINLNINIEIFQETPQAPINYKSFKCSEKEINKREYYLYKDLEIISKIYDK